MKAALPLAAAGVLAAGLATPAAGQQIHHLIVFGHDACPRSSGEDEIVICARKPESERFRIPRALRDQPNTGPAGRSWAYRARSLEYVGRTGIQSCSTVGPGGWTGCLNQMISTARAERAQAQSNARVP
jgi:hypothetical protein